MEDWESTSGLQSPVGEGDRKQEYKTKIPPDFQTALQILSFLWEYWEILFKYLRVNSQWKQHLYRNASLASINYI